MLLKIAIHGTECGIGQMKPCGVETELTRIDENPGFVVDVETVRIDEAGINGVDPLASAGVNLSPLIRDHEGTSLADRDTWWSHLDFYWHTSFLWLLEPFAL